MTFFRVRSRFNIFVFLLFLLFSQNLFAPTGGIMRQIAVRNLAHFLILKSLGLLDGPYTIAMDGPPGVGKSSLAKPIKELLSEAVGGLGRTLKVGTFSQDDFLRSRKDRAEKFTPIHGADGISGNCDGREYRWEDMKECVEKVLKGGQYEGYVYRPGQKPDLQPGGKFDYSELDILIFEGTHSTGRELFPFMHSTLYLGAAAPLIRFNRLQRGYAEQKREWSKCQRMADVAESQYPKFIHPNSQRVQYVFRLISEKPVPDVEPSMQNNWPVLERSLEMMYEPFSCLIELSEDQKNAMEGMLQLGVLQNPDDPNLTDTIFASPAFFWEQLTHMLHEAGFQLSNPARDGSCFFTALAQAYKMLGIRNRDEAIALLRRLQAQIQAGAINNVQQQVINDVSAILSEEIEFISHPQHWGGLTTMMYLWAALLGSDNPPTEPVYLLLRTGTKVVILILNPGGTVTETTTLPTGANVLVYDGGTHWMWAGPSENTASLTSLSEPESDDSGIFSPALSRTPSKEGPMDLLNLAMGKLLISSMVKRMAY